MARVSGLPKSGADVATLLKIETLRGIEHWQRYFGGHSLATRQWASKDGLLMECFNGWELGFALAEEEGALIYHQRRAHLRLGPMRLRAPLAIAPRVHAREQCAGKGRTTVEVIVTLPLIGILIVYSGELHTRDQANQ